MQRFLIFGVGGPTSANFPASGSDEADLPITSSFEFAVVGHVEITSSFNVDPTDEDLAITSSFTVTPTGEDLAITSSFITAVT